MLLVHVGRAVVGTAAQANLKRSCGTESPDVLLPLLFVRFSRPLFANKVSSKGQKATEEPKRRERR